MYWDLSSAEHADSFGTATTSFRTDKGRANYCTEPSDPWLYMKAAGVACPRFMHITDLTLKAFGLSEAQQLDQLQGRFWQLDAAATEKGG